MQFFPSLFKMTEKNGVPSKSRMRNKSSSALFSSSECYLQSSSRTISCSEYVFFSSFLQQISVSFFLRQVSSQPQSLWHSKSPPDCTSIHLRSSLLFIPLSSPTMICASLLHLRNWFETSQNRLSANRSAPMQDDSSEETAASLQN